MMEKGCWRIELTDCGFFPDVPVIISIVNSYSSVIMIRMKYQLSPSTF